MAFVVAETLEQAHEWWLADILWYRWTVGGEWVFVSLADPTCGDPDVDTDPHNYGIQLGD